MFRKLFWLIVFLFGYMWMVSSDNEKALFAKAKHVYNYWMRAAEEKEVKVHVHTPECMKKNEKMTKKKKDKF